MAKQTVTFNVSIAWWFYCYLHCLAFFARLTGSKVDEAKVGYWLRKATTITTKFNKNRKVVTK